MKDGIIEQLDTPANIVLNPATEYVRKFTEEVPREKVLKIESIMDPIDSSIANTIKISKDELVEKEAEKILNSSVPLIVIDPKTNVIVGSINSQKVIKVLFGDSK
jgi:glycine betaine/proline transport system ATP-binding protein